MKSILKMSLMSVIFILCGCSANGIKYNERVYEPLNGKTEIVVFRKSKFAASGGCYRVKINGEEVGILANGGYIQSFVDPGHHTVSVIIGDEMELKIDAEENSQKYIELIIGLSGLSAFPVGTVSVVNTSWDISLVDTPSDYGIEEVSNLRESLKTNTCMSS